VCRHCGCTDLDPCIVLTVVVRCDASARVLLSRFCRWHNRAQTVCNSPACVEKEHR